MDDLNQKINQGVQGYASGSRFGLTPIPRHIHNGTDSPVAFQPIITYIGEVSSSAATVLLPSGWTATQLGTGQYKVTHSLGSTNYQVVANARNTAGAYANIGDRSANTFQVNIFIPSGGTYASQNNDFGFILTFVNNRYQPVPSYIT